MKRSELRENIFKIIFSVNQENNSITDYAMEYYISDNNISEKDGDYIKNEVNGIIENLSEIDACISKKLKNYTIDRISKVNLSILRVATYEINYASDIPDSVAISEALKLVESYDDEKSKGYINGVLGSISRAKEN